MVSRGFDSLEITNNVIIKKMLFNMLSSCNDDYIALDNFYTPVLYLFISLGSSADDYEGSYKS